MKRLLSIALLSCISLGFAQNQGKAEKSLEERVQQRIEFLDKDLQLNENQKKELTAYFTEKIEANQKIMQSRKQERNQLKKEIKSERAERAKKREQVQERRAEIQKENKQLRIENEAKMQTVLTPTQYEKWTQITEEQREKRKERRLSILEKRKERIQKRGQ